MKTIEEIIPKILSGELNQEDLTNEEMEMVKKYCNKESKEMQKKIKNIKKENEKKLKQIEKYKRACKIIDKKEEN